MSNAPPNSKDMVSEASNKASGQKGTLWGDELPTQGNHDDEHMNQLQELNQTSNNVIEVSESSQENEDLFSEEGSTEGIHTTIE